MLTILIHSFSVKNKPMAGLVFSSTTLPLRIGGLRTTLPAEMSILRSWLQVVLVICTSSLVLRLTLSHKPITELLELQLLLQCGLLDGINADGDTTPPKLSRMLLMASSQTSFLSKPSGQISTTWIHTRTSPSIQSTLQDLVSLLTRFRQTTA